MSFGFKKVHASKISKGRYSISTFKGGKPVFFGSEKGAKSWVQKNKPQFVEHSDGVMFSEPTTFKMKY